MVQQDGAQVAAQGASGAFAAAVHFAFVSAGAAGVVAGDPCAGQADGPWIRAVETPGKDAVVPAVGADAAGAHRGVEAAVAELISGPFDPQPVGFALASIAFVVASGDWRPSAACGSRLIGAIGDDPRASWPHGFVEFDNIRWRGCSGSGCGLSPTD